ncbi:MAG: hypothetical protein J6N52_02305 [Clostridia bacterium]|nr:hypothetical protein [Clostridia bacterium]
MTTKWFTNKTLDVRQIAINERGEDFNRGLGTTRIIRTIKENHYLLGSDYEVNSSYINGRNKPSVTPEFIKSEIDNGRPLMLTLPQHVVVIVGYDYTNADKMVICSDSASKIGYDVTEKIIDIVETKRNIIYFNRK